MTDKELDGLFRKHVPQRGPDAWATDPRAEFVGSPFYAFARELEHRALAAGMLMAAMDPLRAPQNDNASAARPAKATLLGSLFAWVTG